MAGEYDIEKAFERIENELIDSMMRNFARHRDEEDQMGIDWSMWQAEQLKTLEAWKKANAKKYPGQFAKVNKKIETLLRKTYGDSQLDQEREILEAIRDGFLAQNQFSDAAEGSFFKLNEQKLDALIKSVTGDFEKAETAILRRANDQYRQIIYAAQVYANTGAGTYEKAVDMATKDFLSRGIDCIEYKNGARHNIKDYSRMAIRTANKRAQLQAEGDKRREWGVDTVIVHKRGNPCPKCLPFVGKVFIDDVWSGGSKDGKSSVTGVKYPLMSTAIAAGLYHPNCKDGHSTYYEGVNDPPDDRYTRDELDALAEEYQKEQKTQYAKRQAEKYERLSKYSLDPENQRQYAARAEEWGNIHFKTGNMSMEQYVKSKRPLANFMAVPADEVAALLLEESQEWIDQLTPEEIRAIKKYAYNPGDEKPNRFFERLNAMLRGARDPEERIMKYADVISKAIKKNALKHDVIAYRGVSVDVVADKNIGEIFSLGQYTSTSVAPEGAFNNAYKLIIYVRKGANAAYIEKLSHFPNQKELLLDKDCVYKLLSRKGDTCELEVIE